MKTNKNPGPGQYNPNPEFIDTQSTSKYSIRQKFHEPKQGNEKYPGPGNY